MNILCQIYLLMFNMTINHSQTQMRTNCEWVGAMSGENAPWYIFNNYISKDTFKSFGHFKNSRPVAK